MKTMQLQLLPLEFLYLPHGYEISWNKNTNFPGLFKYLRQMKKNNKFHFAGDFIYK